LLRRDADESLRGNSDDRVRYDANLQRLTDDILSAELALPVSIIENGDGGAAWYDVFGCVEEAAEDGRTSKNEKNEALTAATGYSRAASPVPTAQLFTENAAVCENERVSRCRSKYRVYGNTVLVITRPREFTCR